MKLMEPIKPTKPLSRTLYLAIEPFIRSYSRFGINDK